MTAPTARLKPSVQSLTLDFQSAPLDFEDDELAAICEQAKAIIETLREELLDLAATDSARAHLQQHQLGELIISKGARIAEREKVLKLSETELRRRTQDY